MDDVHLMDIKEALEEREDERVFFQDKEMTVKRDVVKVTMDVCDPFDWLHKNQWTWIADWCYNSAEYERLDDIYNQLENMREGDKELKADYDKNFPLLLVGVFENLAEGIRSGEIVFDMDYDELQLN